MWTTQKLAGPILRDFLFLPLKIPHFLYCPIPFYYENQKTLIILLLSFHPETQHISHFGISPMLTFGGPGFSASGFYTPTFGKLSYLFPMFLSIPSLVFCVSTSTCKGKTMRFLLWLSSIPRSLGFWGIRITFCDLHHKPARMAVAVPQKLKDNPSAFLLGVYFFFKVEKEEQEEVC